MHRFSLFLFIVIYNDFYKLGLFNVTNFIAVTVFLQFFASSLQYNII